MTRTLPSTASVAETAEGAKLHAPAAARNAAAITAFLSQVAPDEGTALEIASGTGQHISAFAVAMPGLRWQPTDVDPDRLRSIDAYVTDARLDNVSPAQLLDATKSGWSADHGPRDMILLINLLHLISEKEVQTLIGEAAHALAPGGVLILYGPFARAGELTSDGDRRFDAQLRAADPSIGYKDTSNMTGWLEDAGLRVDAPHEMPANNLAFVGRKPAT
ncbi:MAG: DUF938 domain-containing protein [Sulfitobacter sp.]|nr:DUF938 domain-containing protein [Sulfitobacter sp.]